MVSTRNTEIDMIHLDKNLILSKVNEAVASMKAHEAIQSIDSLGNTTQITETILTEHVKDET